jgi:replicative DNA helicase
MIDTILLRVLRNSRQDHQRLYSILPRNTLDPKTLAIADDFEKYYKLMKSHDSVDMPTFVPRFKQWHPKMTKDEMSAYILMFSNSMKEPDDDQRNMILNDMAELNMVTRLASLAMLHEEGSVDDIFGEITQVLDEYRTSTSTRTNPYVDDPIEDLLQEEFNDEGIAWRLGCLQQSMRKLRPGDFGIIAGRPDKGKTSFVASEITYWAAQLPANRGILWLNNEGPGRRIIPRLYQAALDLSIDGLKAASTAGELVGAFEEAIGGTVDRIRVCDVHGYNTGQIEQLLQNNNPGVIIYDMIDNIHGFGDAARTDLKLEQMYQWARERSVKYNSVGIATSQISNDGDGLMFPTLGMLKDSKTGKQGACDFQIMIGSTNDPMLAGSRFIGIPKNKLRKADGPSDPRAEVRFNGLTSRYTDVPLDAGMATPEEDTE